MHHWVLFSMLPIVYLNFTAVYQNGGIINELFLHMMTSSTVEWLLFHVWPQGDASKRNCTLKRSKRKRWNYRTSLSVLLLMHMWRRCECIQRNWWMKWDSLRTVEYLWCAQQITVLFAVCSGTTVSLLMLLIHFPKYLQLWSFKTVCCRKKMSIADQNQAISQGVC